MRTRFAPSPTGYLHIGNIRTAFFSFLASRQQHSEFLLRIEDTDTNRSKQEFSDALIEDLRWLGLLGGELQHENITNQLSRVDIYQKYLQQLVDNGSAYRCYCSDEQLQMSREMQQRQKQAPKYDGKCAHLTAADWLQEGKQTYALRFRIGENRTLISEDLVRGKREYKSENIGDFIICRREGTPSFLFSNAIDDSLMDIDVAVRGEDHLTNVPCQQLILESLGLRQPQWAHLSVVTNNEGKPMSKRDGVSSLRILRQQGYLPEAILNYLFRLGHNFSSNEFLTLDQMAEHFSFRQVSTSPVKFDHHQLNHWQEVGVRHLSGAKLRTWIMKFYPDSNLSSLTDNKLQSLVGMNAVFPDQALELCKSILDDELVYSKAAIDDIINSQEALFDHAIQQVTATGTLDFRQLAQSTNCKGKKMYHPIRLALTSLNWGPELSEIIDILGREKLLKRLRFAETLATTNS